ncbi:hypothetical protein Acor_26130 [Acrocarpospora corrugata]|uniref:Uncharacterized protein n=1 Tax=Acrocarpospora corrugata TaxID=35763 RepID=A0A5M3VWI9_9ACTN|nr:hypothetical protein [Acrocarpospora corrugata]GES00549.1 hypothetical protein Acor_26130 [Acrocarpospora corrugata]
MGLLSNLLLPGRLRTGPTVLLPAKVKPDALLEAVQLADPTATQDGEELLAAGTRIHAPLELTADLLRKLSIKDEERLWAYRVVAERPLPMDYYDKFLAAGIAYRYGGWSLCEGSADDPAEDETRLAAVYLPEMPDQEELATLLRGLLRLPEPTAEADTEAAEAGVTELTPDEAPAAAATPDETAAEESPAGESSADEAPAAEIEPETEAAEAGVTALAPDETPAAAATPDETAAEKSPTGESSPADEAPEAEASDETTSGEAESGETGSGEAASDGVVSDETASDEAEAEDDDAEAGDSGLVIHAGQTIVYTGADIQVTASYENRFPAVVAGLLPYATEVVRIAVRALEDGELAGDDVVLEPGKVALALGQALDGPVVDAWGFQILEAEDLLPARRV